MIAVAPIIPGVIIFIMKNVLCIGEALIDMICTDKGKPLSEGQHFLKRPGGAPANVAAAIAALGGRVALAARVGSDPFGQSLVDVLRSFGVSVEWIFRDDRYFTTLAFVSLMESGEKDFYFNRGADGRLSIEDTARINLDDYSIIHFGSATAFLPGPLQAAYTDLLQRAAQKNIFTSFDPNYRHLLFGDNTKKFIDQSWQFIPSCHFFKVSDEEALLLTRSSSLEEAVAVFSQKTPAVFAITLGKEGTLLRAGGKTAIIESIPVKQVDSTGAGDAFVGAVLYQLSLMGIGSSEPLSPDEWEKIIYNANKAGARTCEHFGAMEALKFLSNDIFNREK